MSKTLVARQTRIGSTLSITDTIQANEDLIVDCLVRTSKIDVKKNTLVIGKNGDVQCDVYADTVVIQGKYSGNIYADTCIEIETGAVVSGDLTSNKFIIDPGGRFDGRLKYQA